ncbi:hypothetical protein ACLOJK_041456 [Asimina triloba]
MQGMNVRFAHQFREGNQVADFLAKLGESGSSRTYEDLQDLPRLLRGIVRIDKSGQQGIWKCRHCSWNYRMGSHGMDHVHSHEEYARGVVNAKTLSQLGSCFFSPSKGSESTEGKAGTNFSTVARANAENNHGNGEADLEINNLDTLNGLSNVQNDRSQIDMRVQSKIGSNGPSLEKTKFTSVIESADENLPQKVKMNGLQSCNETPQKDVVDSAEKNFEAVEITYIDDGKSPMNMKTESQLDSTFIDSKGYGESGMTALEPVKEVIGESSHGILVQSVKEVIGESSHGILVHSGKTIVEMDVERVLEEQDTHDLYCPHCNSCITRRVILSKRKRTMGGLPSGTKRERTEPLLQPGFSESPAATDEASHVTCPDVFTCLSCFSIFIPTADGFKSFWISRRNTEGENLQSPHQTPAKNLNWISAIFEAFRAKNTRNEPGRETSECVQEDNFRASDQFQNASETQTGVEIQGELIPGKYKANAAENVGSETKKPSQETSQGPSEPGETRQVANGLKWNGLIKLNGTVVSNRQPVKADVNEEQKHPSVVNNGNELASPVSETPLVTDDQNSGGKVPQVGGNSVIMSIPGVLSPHGVLIIDKRPQDVATPAVPEADSIQPVEEGIVSTEGVVSSQNNQTLSSSPASGVSTGGETIIDLPQQEVDTTRRHEWDILKSVVYGGLVESVTSLGILQRRN